jgi:tetratricopeptide (TPR) repeat protein
MVSDGLRRAAKNGSRDMNRLTASVARGVLAGLTLCGLGTAAIAAQPVVHQHGHQVPHTGYRFAPYWSFGPGFYYGGHASTFQEGVLHGEADLVRAWGEQNLNNAQALRHFEEAVDRALDNQVKTLATRQEREMMARQHRAEVARLKQQRQAEARSARLQAQAEEEAQLDPFEQAAKTERLAAGKLELARKLQEQGHVEKAREWMQEIVAEYPGTAAAREVGVVLAAE